VATATEPISSIDATTQYYQRIAATSKSPDRVKRAERMLAKRTSAPPRQIAPDAAGAKNATDKADQMAEKRRAILALVSEGAVHSQRDIANRLSLPYAQLSIIIKPLVSAGTLMCVPAPGNPNRSAYRLSTEADRASLPKVRQIDVPRFDPLQLRQKVESILRSGASYDLNEITRNARAVVPEATAEIVGQLLETLIADGGVRRIPIGSFTRYQAVA
jgi:DNA-binding Lrp family transcriptional regulator